MTESEHDWIEYWAVFTEASGQVMSDEFHSEWTAQQFKRVTEQRLKEAQISGTNAWIEHGHYDGMLYQSHRQYMEQWGLPLG
jgi:hypothetical protein